MLFVSKEKDIINSKPGDLYFDRVKSFIDEWLTGSPYLEVQTSGSTGPVKTIRLSREQIKASVNQTARAFHLNEDSLFICNLNLDFIAGKLQIIRALELNAELMIIHPSDDFTQALLPQRAVILRNYRRAFMAFVPLQLVKILESPVGRELLNAAGAIILGGAAVSSALESEINQLNAPVYATFGMTETVTHFAIKRLNGPEKDLHFTPLPDTEIGISKAGTLMVKNACTKNEWLITNDLVSIHQDGSFDISGRADRVINSGGVKLSLDKMEQKIDRLLSLKSPFFCAALPDERLGQKLVLFIESDTDQSKLLPVLKENMSKFESPKQIITLAHFDRTKTGKIDKLRTTHAYSVSDQ